MASNIRILGYILRQERTITRDRVPDPWWEGWGRSILFNGGSGVPE